MKTSIILGLNFGDEGKGLVTSYLSKRDDLVVRFSGGHQAGHTVVDENGYRHVFSNFGAGTLKNAHTYWSEYCTFYPIAFLNEYNALVKVGKSPQFYIHPLCAVTTPFDFYYNRALELSRNPHGSVGVGFGATVERHEQTPFKLFAQDLHYPDLFEYKINLIGDYYNQKANQSGLKKYFEIADFEVLKSNYLQVTTQCENLISSEPLSQLKKRYDSIIFEGSQGILLDKDFGFFPHVTRANTTSKNAMKIIRENQLPEPEIYYVTRSYLTRHGMGILPYEKEKILISENREETNIYNQWQGDLRKSYLCSKMLAYAVGCDRNYSEKANKNIVVTCLDQTEGYMFIDKRRILMEEMKSQLRMIFSSAYTSYSDKSELVSFF